MYFGLGLWYRSLPPSKNFGTYRFVKSKVRWGRGGPFRK